jgi:hypothetical protein
MKQEDLKIKDTRWNYGCMLKILWMTFTKRRDI